MTITIRQQNIHTLREAFTEEVEFYETRYFYDKPNPTLEWLKKWYMETSNEDFLKMIRNLHLDVNFDFDNSATLFHFSTTGFHEAFFGTIVKLTNTIPLYEKNSFGYRDENNNFFLLTADVPESYVPYISIAELNNKYMKDTVREDTMLYESRYIITRYVNRPLFERKHKQWYSKEFKNKFKYPEVEFISKERAIQMLKEI